MSLKIGDNFNYQGQKFNFERDCFTTLSEMKNYPETSIPPHGFRTFCEEDRKYYEFNIDNEINETTGKWREVVSNQGTSDYSSLTNKPQINNIELTGNKSLEDLGIQAKGDYVTETLLEEKGYAVATEVDLTYAKKTDLDNKVDKEEGKSLVSDSEIAKLSTLKNYDDTEIKSEVSLLKETKQDKGDYALKSELESKQDILVSGENIKTINGLSIVGDGNLDLTGESSGALSFAGIIENTPTDADAGIDGNAITVFYSSTSKGFIIKKEEVYYNQWNNSSLWNDENKKPYSSRIYSYDNKKYLWDGNDLVEAGYVITYNIPEAPKDGKLYGRKNEGWAVPNATEVTLENYSIASELGTINSQDNVSTAIGKVDKRLNSAIYVEGDGEDVPSENPSIFEADRAVADENGNNIVSTYSTKTEVSTKQDKLVSGTNIKTINGQDILGEGNIVVEGGAGGSGISDAPSDGKKYIRSNGNWVEEAKIDTSNFATKTELESKADKSELPDISDILTKTEAAETYATTEQLETKANKVNTQDIEGATPTQEIEPNKFYKFGEVTTLNITFAAETPNIVNEYMFQFTSGTTPTVLTLPENVKWIGSSVVEASKTYQVSILNNLAVMGGV